MGWYYWESHNKSQAKSGYLQLFVINWTQIYLGDLVFLSSSWHNSWRVKRKWWKWNLFCTSGSSVSQPGDTSLFVCCNSCSCSQRKCNLLMANIKLISCRGQSTNDGDRDGVDLKGKPETSCSNKQYLKVFGVFITWSKEEEKTLEVKNNVGGEIQEKCICSTLKSQEVVEGSRACQRILLGRWWSNMLGAKTVMICWW